MQNPRSHAEPNCERLGQHLNPRAPNSDSNANPYLDLSMDYPSNLIRMARWAPHQLVFAETTPHHLGTTLLR